MCVNVFAQKRFVYIRGKWCLPRKDEAGQTGAVEGCVRGQDNTNNMDMCICPLSPSHSNILKYNVKKSFCLITSDWVITTKSVHSDPSRFFYMLPCKVFLPGWQNHSYSKSYTEVALSGKHFAEPKCATDRVTLYVMTSFGPSRQYSCTACSPIPCARFR